MKANEAPKKIFVNPNALQNSGYNGKNYMFIHDSVFDESKCTIEYTRTDAFIEKACDAYCAICDTKECDGCAECSWVIKFRRQLLKY